MEVKKSNLIQLQTVLENFVQLNKRSRQFNFLKNIQTIFFCIQSCFHENSKSTLEALVNFQSKLFHFYNFFWGEGRKVIISSFSHGLIMKNCIQKKSVELKVKRSTGCEIILVMDTNI